MSEYGPRFVARRVLGWVAVSFLMSVLIASPARAQIIVLYDESTAGDVDSEIAPENLGALVAGTYVIRGSLCFGGACGPGDPGDAYCFEILDGFELNSGKISVTNVVGVGGFTRVREWDDACSFLGIVESLGDVGPGTHPLTQTPYPGGTNYGPGVFFASGTVSGDRYDYEWTFVVTSCSGSARLLHDDAAGSDPGSEVAPLDLGTLSAGTYTIRGSLCFGGACGPGDAGDVYCFGIPDGFEITAGEVTISNVVGVGAFTRIDRWDDNCGFLGAFETLGEVGAGTHHLTTVPYAGGTRYGPAMFLASGTVSGDRYDYEWTFVVTCTGGSDVLIDCDAGQTAADNINRGFYVPGYLGFTLDQAVLYFSASTAGTYTFALTARAGAYDGPIIARDQATVVLTASPSSFVPATFDFGTQPVDVGSVVTFDIDLISGPATIAFYAVGPTFDCTPNPGCPVFETQGTSPPLDTCRRNEVRVRILGRTGVSAVDGPGVPAEPALRVRPNPFSRSTALSYRLAADGPVQVEVYDLSGRRVRTLVDEAQAAGLHEAVWDGRGSAGSRLPAGIYFFAVRADGRVRTAKLILLR